MMERFAGKVALVTGGASGIGAATVRRFAEEGATVISADLEATTIESVEGLSGQIISHSLDVTDYDAFAKLVSQIVAEHGALDVLVNNAGISGAGLIADLPVEDWHKVIDVDLNSVFYGCKIAIPVMQKQGHGNIINMGSISGLFGDHTAAAYNAAKGAVVNFTRSLAIDHAEQGLRINAVCPGPIDTPIIALAKEVPGVIDTWLDAVPMGRFGLPEEIAGAVTFLGSDDASFITGTTLTVDGGITAGTHQPNFAKIVNALVAQAEG